MAIIPLKKVFVYCMKADVKPVVHALQERGVIHVAPAEAQAGQMHQLTGDVKGEEILDRIGFALEVIHKHDAEKGSFLSAKPDITTDEYRSLKEKADTVDEAYAAAKDLEDRLSSIRSGLQRKKSQIASLAPFISLDMSLSYLRGTQKTDVFLGYLPEEEAGPFMDELAGLDGLAHAEFFEKAEQALPVLIVAHKKKSRQVREMAKASGFSDARLENLEGTPAEITQILESEISVLRAQKKEALKGAGDVLKYKDDLLALEDFYRGEVLRERALEKIMASQSVAVIEGYVKHYEQEKLEQAVSSVADVYHIEATDPEEDDENLPTAVENNAVVTPFEAVTDMYSVPGPRTFDANALMMPFYFIFFGMMLSDAAYGIILTVGSIVFLKVKKPEGAFKKILMVLAICGISTIIWGTSLGLLWDLNSSPGCSTP